MNLEKNKDKTVESVVPAFTKQQFLSSKQRADQKDLINALLVDGETYSNDQVDSIISEFLGKVAE